MSLSSRSAKNVRVRDSESQTILPGRRSHLRLQIEFFFWSTVTVSLTFREQGECSVPVATKNENKSGFVREFLSKHPEGNVKAVNEAWASAGMQGTIGDTLIYQTRAEMGLSGKLRAKSKLKTAGTAKSPTKMSKAASSPGKTMFVKEYLNDHPQANVSAVNKAWQAAGFKGTISAAVVNKLRASMGLTGNLRANTKKTERTTTGKKRETPRKESTVNVPPRANRSSNLDDIEADFDRLLFKVMGVGDLTEIEALLRKTRRMLYGALSRG
jgi:hypothetical protein